MTKFVVWWQYEANWAAPEITEGIDAEDAWNKTFPFYKNTHNILFHKYAVEIKKDEDLHIGD
jgi:hypothetical protein